MFFRKLQVTNFHSHVDTALEFARLTFIRGANGTGKSSIEQAIQLALAGRADATTSDGKGVAGYIRAGEAKASVTLAVRQDMEERILRCALTGDKKPAVIVTKPSDPQYGGGAEYLEYLALHRDVLSCLTNNRYFVDLPEKEQKDILARIILPKTYAWPEWVRPAIAEAGLQVNWSRTPFEIIDAAYDATFKERTNVNRDIKNFRMPEGDTAEAVNLERYSKALGRDRTKLEDAQRRKYEAESESRLRLATLEAARGRYSQTQARIDREQQSLAGMESHLLSPAKVKEVEKSAKNAARAEALDKDILKFDAEIAAAKDAFKKLQAISDAPACPTCGATITEESMAAIAKPLVDQRNQLEECRRNAIDSRKALGNPAEAASLLEKHNRATEDLKKSRARIAEDQAIVADAEAAIAELDGKSSRDTSSIAAEIEEANTLIARASDLVANARSAKDLLGHIDAAKRDREALTRRQVLLEKLVAYFGANGVKAELLSESIGGFTTDMNSVLANWGYLCSVSIEPFVFAIAFRAADGNPVHIGLSHMSKSQRYRFATAFQIALAQVTGFGFVIVDEADIYDKAGRDGLFEALDSGALEQAIIIGTDERDTVPAIEGTAFYSLHNLAEQGTVPLTSARALRPAAAQAA